MSTISTLMDYLGLARDAVREEIRGEMECAKPNLFVVGRWVEMDAKLRRLEQEAERIYVQEVGERLKKLEAEIGEADLDATGEK